MATKVRTTSRDEVAERTTPVVTMTLRDLDGAALPAASLSSVFVTIFNDQTGTVVRARESALNTGIGTVSSAGVLAVALTEADTAILVTAEPKELRVVLVEWAWLVGGVPKSSKHEFAFDVKNLKQVPAP